MNRVKVWVFTLAVVAGAYAGLRLHVQQLRAAALSDLDARLAAASAQVLAATRALARESSAAAALAARDARLLAALHPAAPPPPVPAPKGARKGPAPAATPAPPDAEGEEAAVREAARAALAGAERTLGFDLPQGTAAVAVSREALSRRDKGAEGETTALLAAAAAGKEQRGWIHQNGALYHAAAAPAGDGGGIVVLAPVDEAWAKALAGVTGAQVTISVPDAKPISTAGRDAQAFAGWSRGAGVPADVGRLGGAPFSLGPLRVGALPLPFGGAPAFRARAVQLEGLKDGFVVAAVPTAAALGAVARLHWEVALGIALVLLAGLVLGFFVRASEAPAALPDELLAAASRIERGDFGARVPPLAGKFGTLGAALNKAAELAGPAAAAETARAAVARDAPAPTRADEEEVRPAAPAAPPPAIAAPAPREEPPPPAPAAAPAQVTAPAQLAAAPAATPATAGAAAAPVVAAPATPSSAPGVDEDGHFRQVFQDFLRTRASCGEVSEGLTYEKFRLKLDGNKAALVAKYGCKTVRFQVYVKDGKAALKATPVK